MEGLNKKVFFSVLAAYGFLQMVFLLAISANFLLAEMDPDSGSMSSVGITVAENGNRKDFQATSNMPLESVMFYFDNLNDSSSSLQFPGILTDTTDLTNWSLNLADGYLVNNTDYNFYAIGFYRGISYESINYIFIPKNNEDTSSNDGSSDTTMPNDTQNDTVDSDYYSDDSDPAYDDPIYDNSATTSDSSAINNTTDTDNMTISNDNTTDDIINDATNITNPLKISFIETIQSPLFDEQRISISSNQEVFSCIFKIYGPKYAEFPAIKDSPNKYHIILCTKDFPNGNYTIKAVAGNNIGTADIRLDVKIENLIAIENPIAPEPDQPPITEPISEKPLTIETQPETETYPMAETQPADKIYPAIEAAPTTHDNPVYPKTFVFELPAECKKGNLSTPEECQKYMSIPFECREKNILNLEECEKFMMENFMPSECKKAGITTKEECAYLLRNTFTSFESFSTIEIKQPYAAQTEEKISEECKKQGIASFEECEKHMMLINMPEECRQAEVTDSDECKKIMFKKYGPQECIQAQIFNAEECEKFMFEEYAPDDCREAGILNPEACKKFMFEKYGGGENIPAEKFPIECQKANAKTVEECEKVMQKAYMPKECMDEGIENEQECEIYLQQKHMPEECLEASAKNRQECDKIMFKKFGHPECKIADIEDEKECEEFIFNNYAPKIKCDNIEDWQCKTSIKERHLGNIVAKQTVFNKINEKKEEIIGKSMKARDLEMEIIKEEEIIPIVKKDIGIKIIATSESIVLNEEDYLIQTAPIAFMIDSDEDGLPDDIEKRLGTDPNKADTDEDGFSDGEEVKNGYNPLGEGEFEKKIAPIEKAIMENKLLGHPKIEGEETENFFVENISNTEDAQGNSVKGYVLSGMAKPNSVATLYIYSDLPVVVTVDADQYGNWRYQLDQSLIEGEHEVYVAINDDTGKVIEKSKPLNFFVKEASAVSVKDFVSVAKASSEESKKSEVSIFNYLLVALLMAIVGIFLFLAIIINRKKNQSLQ